MAEWVQPIQQRGLVWYTDWFKTNKGTGGGASEGGTSFTFGLHITSFQAGISIIQACLMENVEYGYKGRNIYILPNSQAAIKALDSFQVNSKLVWDCHQSLAKLAE